MNLNGSGQTRRVLLVDDDLELQKLLQGYLAQHGFDVYGTKKAFEWPLIEPDSETVALLSKHTFDVSEYVVRLAKDCGLAPIEAMPKDTAIAFLCRSGGRSAQAAEHFRARGFSEVYNVEGGINAWAQVEPSLRPY